jgi:hypothetical protein
VRDADRVRDLELAAVGETRRDDVLGRVARGVRRRAVDLRRVLAREGAAAVSRRAAVGVDDDLPAGDARVPHRASHHELPRRVHVDEVALLEPPLVVEVAREDRVQDVLDDVRLDQRVDVEALAVLRRDEDALDLDRPLATLVVDLVANRHLRLPVRTQVRQDLRTANLGKALRDLVRQHDRERHQLVRLVAGEAEHHPLVARADPVERVVVARVVLDLVRRLDPLRDVGRLLVDRDDHATRLGVEAVLRAVVADLRDRLPDEARDVHVRLRRDLPRDDDEPRRHERLAGDAARGIVCENSVEDGVRDLVGDLVGMTLGDGLAREEKLPRHGGTG